MCFVVQFSFFLFSRRGSQREDDGEAGAGDGAAGFGADVGGEDAAAVHLDDLARDRQAEAGVLAEILVRTIGVEAVEDLLHRLRIDAGAVVIDHDIDIAAVALAGDANVAALRRK